jgi:anthranilate/para-aminobenzoate synthase component I
MISSKLKSSRQIPQITQSVIEITEKLALQEYFFCFDYNDEWRILTWSNGPKENPQKKTSNPHRLNRSDAASQMPFLSGWIVAIQYNKTPNNHQSYYCSCSLGFHYPTKKWYFYGTDDQEQRLLEQCSIPSPLKKDSIPQSDHSSMSREEYISAVQRIKEEIEEGNVYQINLSYRIGPFSIPNPAHLWSKLVEENPSRHAFFWQTPSETILCNSPELFYRRQANQIESIPIKGTNPNINQAKNYVDLWTSPKEKAELTMIVDMMRNDFGRICQAGTVFVEGRKIRRCGDLLHAEQRIIGTLPPQETEENILLACFPAASITGTPKIAALKLIQELESTERRWYTGSLGFIPEHSSQSEWNVCIRCIIIQENQGYIHVGAGIVYDSDPEQEWLETQAKAKALRNSILGH